MPPTVLHENIMKIVGICIWFVVLFEVEPVQKHQI